jgi:hypothetical protein
VLLFSTQSCSDRWNGVISNANHICHTDELYGPRIGSETPHGLKQLIHTLDIILPGIGVKKRFYTLHSLTHQKIADVLGNNGWSASLLEI